MCYLFIQWLEEIESDTEESVKMCWQEEGMEHVGFPFGRSGFWGLALLYCWWRVICDLTAVLWGVISFFFPPAPRWNKRLYQNTFKHVTTKLLF